MNLKEIIELPNQIAIPLLIHKCKNTGIEKNKRVEEFFIDYKSLRYLVISYKIPIKLLFELVYEEELYASTATPDIFGGGIHYSQYKEIYDNIDLDTNQFILTFGKDPFSLKEEMRDFTENVGLDIFEEVKQFLMEITSG